MDATADIVTLVREFGTGWKGFMALWSILVAYVLHGYLPKRYEVKMDFRKFELEHKEKMKQLQQRVEGGRKDNREEQ